MARESPEDSQQPNSADNSQNVDDLFCPRFKSVAAMAGWDKEALPCSTSRRKRRAQRKNPVSIPIAPLNLEEEEEISKQESDQESIGVEDEKKTKVNETNPLHCKDKLREELSCAICLDIWFEPSTTPCGHSFCKKCLRLAPDKCGRRCPKCRQLISNGRSCTVNTILWNTIQLLFPKDVEARKSAGSLNRSDGVECRSQESQTRCSTQRTRTRGRVQYHAMAAKPAEGGSCAASKHEYKHYKKGNPVRVSTRTRRRGMPGQDEDAALALRLQREEFMEAFRGSSGHNHQQERIPLSLARANLRAMASRAINRGRC
ncbi:NAC domain protein [Hibiscus syriacus]|uniref:RING-type E3 ubiquitin transferase n=1 Tax=Hibiscus syriacus TaxID=106335 RepID=A0A6A3A1P2_HIBSY|nr:NAC domain protein [Hibiscus syriacus]